MTTMDIKKMNIPTLDGPNWGQFSIHLQATACILDCWDVIKEETLWTMPQTYNLLVKPTHPGAQASQADLMLLKLFGTKIMPRH